MANSLRFSCKGRVGFIAWLDRLRCITLCVERETTRGARVKPRGDLEQKAVKAQREEQACLTAWTARAEHLIKRNYREYKKHGHCYKAGGVEEKRDGYRRKNPTANRGSSQMLVKVVTNGHVQLLGLTNG